MRRIVALVLVLAALLVVLWFALGREKPAPKPESAAPAPVAETRAAPPARVESTPAQPVSERVEVAAQPDKASTDASRGPAAQLAELRGRLLLEGGAPAVGAKIRLGGWEANDERVLKYGKPKAEWKELRTDCDADGRFSIRFDPPRAYQFTLEASHPGCATANWRWGEIEPATVIDLGETVLPRGGSITGRVVDAQGRSTRDAWQVYASAFGIAKGDGGASSRVYSQADNETGLFTLENLPPGQVELQAYSEIANWIAGPKVEVRAGETSQADIQYTGPDNSRRITVVAFVRPFHIFTHDVSEILLVAPGQEPRKAQKIANSSQSFSFEDLEPGSYSVTIDDPKFKPWRQDGVQPGQRVSAKLEGGSSVSLAVVDAATRAPIARYALRARFDKSNWRPNEFEVFGADRDPPADGLVAGLISVDQTLIVLAEGYAPCQLALEDLKAGEVRPLTAELRQGATLVARVLQADGKTLMPGLAVTLTPSAPVQNEGQTYRHIDAHPAGQRESRSATDGCARFPGVAAGSYDLRAELTPLLYAEQKRIVLAPDDSEKGCDLVLPPSGWLVGKVLGLEPGAAEGCSLVILHLGLAPDERGMALAQAAFPATSPQNPVAAAGTFRAGPLRAGLSSVTFQFPSLTVNDGPTQRHGVQGPTIDLGLVEIPAGGETQHDFDLRGKLPGRIEAQVTINGAPVPNVQVLAQPPEGNAASIQLDTLGHGTSVPVSVGPVTFIVRDADGDWSWSPAGTWTVASSETLRVQWDIQLVAGSVQLIDGESGLPIAEKDLVISAESDKSFSSVLQRKTDKDGKVSLRLVPDAYRAEFLYERGADARITESPYAITRLDWTASGPANAVLRVAKKP